MICLSAVCSADLFTEDGVHIMREGSSRIIESVWTALVVINPPPTIPMRAWVEEVRAGIQTVGSRTTAKDQKTWETRLDALLRLVDEAGEAVLDRTSRSIERRRRRVKRGLVDIIGEAGKALFGVATQRDVTDIRRAVKQAEKDTAIVYHRMDKMLSVINQTRKYVRENRKDIEQLQQHQQALQTRLLEYGDHLSQLDIQVDRLTVARLIDNLIAQLELIAEEFQQQWRIFRQQKHELERGWLTESTLAPTELESMLRKLRSQGYYTPRAEWYYENLQLTPSWSSDSKLTFKVDIPAAGLTEYLKYRLLYFPVLAKDNFIRKVNALSSAAVNTESGSMISSMTCFGEEPEMCLPSKEVIVHICEYGLLTNGDVKDCPIEISQKTRASDIFRVDTDLFIVSPYTELHITKRCRGREPLTQLLSKPTRISLTGDCTLETSEWRVSGIARGQDTLRYDSEVLTFNRTLNFTWPKQFDLKPMEMFQYNKRVEIPLVNLQQFDEAYIEPISINSRDEFMYVLMCLFAIALIIGVAFVVYRIYFAKHRLRRRGTHEPVEAKRDELSLEEMAMALE